MNQSSTNKRQVGKSWERNAAEYLRRKGYTILFMNYRTRFAEIDIIAQDRDELVFIEVKYRYNEQKGTPLEAVTSGKQKRIRNAARYFLMEHNYDIENTFIRFDVVGVEGDKTEHIKNAF
ncbi:MAG: YraN family protein [Eubacterium sp.]|nr:YraN family protein [Eubacterium sp.]